MVGATMLNNEDLNYAMTAATDWYADQWGGLHSKYDCFELQRHFGYWFRNYCDSLNSLDLNISDAFTIWRADVAPLLGVPA